MIEFALLVEGENVTLYPFTDAGQELMRAHQQVFLDVRKQMVIKYATRPVTVLSMTALAHEIANVLHAALPDEGPFSIKAKVWRTVAFGNTVQRVLVDYRGEGRYSPN